MLEEKIRFYWHVPTSVIAFQKFLLENRNLLEKNNLDDWRVKILEIKDLTNEEKELLEIIIHRIDSTVEEISLVSLFSLINSTAVRYFKDRYVIMKYIKNVTYEDLWNNWYLYTRGCVIDLENVEVVTATMKKFFNINEKPYTSFSNVMRMANKGKITKYIKEDGSCVSISNRHDLLITTPGSFDSNQTVWAKDFIEKNSPNFFSDVKTKYGHLTFVFEYVGPENQIVVFYGKSNVVLLQIIDSSNGRVFTYEEVTEFAKKYGFTPATIVNDSLETLMEEKDDVSKYKSNEQEGWVIRIDFENETFMVKMKCADYMNMHHMISNFLDPKWVFEALLSETFDDKIAHIEVEDIRSIVLKISERIFLWEKGIKEKFLTLFSSFPSEKWADISIINNFHLFESELDCLTNGLDNEDKVKKFIYSFSKGKIEDPNEEIRIKAYKLLIRSDDNFSGLADLDSYKAFVQKQVEKILKEVKQAFISYAFSGQIDEKYGDWMNNLYSEHFYITKDVDDLDDWENTFEKDKTEYYRLAQISKTNLSPAYFNIHEYAKRKLSFENFLKDIIPSLRKEVNLYLLRKLDIKTDFISRYINDDLVIEDELHKTLILKEHFENIKVKEIFPNESQDNINRILKEFYKNLRDLKIDNSYETAKEIFNSISSQLQNQKPYFQEKERFSTFVHKNVPSVFRSYFYEMFNLTKEQREQFARETQFLSLGNIVVDSSKEYIGELDIDFRNLNDIIGDNIVDES